MLPNGHANNLTKVKDFDRRINNILTFKRDLTKISEDDKSKRIFDLEVTEIVNKKRKFKRDVDDAGHAYEVVDPLQKSAQTDFKAPNTLRKKSIQLVNKIFNEHNDVENKKTDGQNSEADCKASLFDTFRYPNISKKFFLLTFNWISLGIVYNSQSYYTRSLRVGEYLVFFIGGAVELPFYFITWYCMDRFGKRWVLCIMMCIGGLACLSCVFVPEEWPWVAICSAMIGRLCAASSFVVFYGQIGKLPPTVLRALAMGAVSFISALGLLAYPYILHSAAYYRALPLIIMGILCVLGGVTSLFLPETLNQPLPQTLGDGEMFGRDFKLLSCVEKPSREVDG